MRHPLNAIVLCALYVFFMGCQSARESSYIAQDINSFRDKKISAVTLKNGETRKYDKIGGRYFEEKRDSGMARQIVGLDANGSSLNVELGRVLEVQCQTTEADAGATALTIILIAGGVVLVLALLVAASFSHSFAE